MAGAQQATQQAAGSPAGGNVGHGIGGGGGNVSNAVARHVQNEIAVVEARLSAEIAKLEGTLRTTEAQRSVDYNALISDLRDIRQTLPTTAKMWGIVATGFGGVVAVAALAWTIFGAGAAITGSFADKVLDRKEAQSIIEKQLADQNQLLRDLRNDHAQGSPGQGQTPEVHQGTQGRGGRP